MMKVALDDIRGIKVGTSVTFTLSHPKSVVSTRQLAYHLNMTEPENKKKYSCKSDFAKRQVTITANKA